MKVEQKDIYLASLNPVKGSEQAGKRPVVVVSGNAMNANMPVVIICPLSSSIKEYSGCVVLSKTKTNKLETDSEIITFQIRALAKERLLKKVGVISDVQLRQVMTGLADVLQY